MRDAILELGEVEVELGAASKAPEEVGIDSGEMVEEPFATGEFAVRDLVILKQLLLREPSDRLVRAGEVADAWRRIDARKEGWMPDAHQASSEIACNSCIGSAGSSFAAGKCRAIQIWIATFSVSGSPSITSTGTLCLGLRRKYSGVMCCDLRKLRGCTSNGAPASVNVT